MTAVHEHSPALADFSWTPRVTAKLYDGSTFAYKADLADAFGHRWQENLSQPGVGQVTLQNTDPVLDLVAFGDLITFSIDAEPAFTFVVEKRTVRAVAAGEEHDQTTDLSGRGALAQLAKAVVYLERNVADWYPYADERTFSFASIFYEMGPEWVTPISFGQQGTPAQTGWQGEDGTDAPHGWPSSGPQLIWAPGATETTAAVGTCYFRGVAVFSDDRLTQVFATADEFFRLYIDGIPMLAEEAAMGGWRKTFSVQVMMKGIPSDATHPAGLAGHIYGFRVQNVDVAGANAAMCLLGQYDLAADGTLGDAVFETNDDATMWWVLPYPDEPPGWTVGAVMIQLLGEASDTDSPTWFGRGVKMSFEPTFTKTHDSDGAPWPVQTDVTVKIGTDYLSAFMGFATSLCDLAVSADGTELHAWNYGTRGTAGAVTLVPGLNLTELTHDGEW